GRRGGALRQYQACVAVLRKELGVEPEAETKRVYQEILQRQARTSAGAARAGEPAAESPLVGREEEVGHLRRTLREILRGQGRVLLLTGETGIGKSRLIEELAAEAGRSGCRVLLGRAYETEQILPFRPWVDALRAGTILSETEARERRGAARRARPPAIAPRARDGTPRQPRHPLVAVGAEHGRPRGRAGARGQQSLAGGRAGPEGVGDQQREPIRHRRDHARPAGK